MTQPHILHLIIHKSGVFWCGIFPTIHIHTLTRMCTRKYTIYMQVYIHTYIHTLEGFLAWKAMCLTR